MVKPLSDVFKGTAYKLARVSNMQHTGATTSLLSANTTHLAIGNGGKGT